MALGNLRGLHDLPSKLYYKLYYSEQTYQFAWFMLLWFRVSYTKQFQRKIATQNQSVKIQLEAKNGPSCNHWLRDWEKKTIAENFLQSIFESYFIVFLLAYLFLSSSMSATSSSLLSSSSLSLSSSSTAKPHPTIFSLGLRTRFRNIHPKPKRHRTTLTTTTTTKTKTLKRFSNLKEFFLRPANFFFLVQIFQLTMSLKCSSFYLQAAQNNFRGCIGSV